MPELKISILHPIKLKKDDHSPVTYRPGVNGKINKAVLVKKTLQLWTSKLGSFGHKVVTMQAPTSN